MSTYIFTLLAAYVLYAICLSSQIITNIWIQKKSREVAIVISTLVDLLAISTIVVSAIDFNGQGVLALPATAIAFLCGIFRLEVAKAAFHDLEREILKNIRALVAKSEEAERVGNTWWFYGELGNIVGKFSMDYEINPYVQSWVMEFKVDKSGDRQISYTVGRQGILSSIFRNRIMRKTESYTDQLTAW